MLVLFYSAWSGLSTHKPVIQRLVAWLFFWDREEGEYKHFYKVSCQNPACPVWYHVGAMCFVVTNKLGIE